MEGFDLEKAIRILKSKKITKEEVAERTAVSPGHLSRMLAGEKAITPRYLKVFIKEFGSELEGVELLEYSPELVLSAQVALEAKYETLKDIIIELVNVLPQGSLKLSTTLNKLVNEDKDITVRILEEMTVEKAKQILKARGQQ